MATYHKLGVKGVAIAEPAAVVEDKLLPLPFVAGRGLIQPEAKLLFPTGATVRKDAKRDPRWQVRAAYLVPSVSQSFVGGDAADDNRALLVCLRSAWVARMATSADKCPFDLDGPLM